MPLTTYSDSQQATLSAFPRMPSFRTRSLTFRNGRTGETIKDAIKVDENGDLIFKDNHTEVYFSELVKRKQYISEEVDGFGSEILYFEDEYNQRITLGAMYENIQRLVNANKVRWFTERKSFNLSGGLDVYIKDVIASGSDAWKNIWHDIPCMFVITPDYYSGKSGHITANISMKVRTDRPLYTGFRIVDGTTGFELARTVHASKGQHGKEVTYNIPLSYQGPLPDSTTASTEPTSVLTYKDLANLGVVVNNEGYASTELDNVDSFVPPTQHVIKVQWIACGIAAHAFNDGTYTEGLTREFDSRGDTSLNVTVFSNTSPSTEVSQLNGTVDFDEMDELEYILKFENTPYWLDNRYQVNVSANKNVNISVLNKGRSGFRIKINRKPKGLKVDWSIIYEVLPSTLDDELNGIGESNHSIFKQRDGVLDFCGELRKVGFIPSFNTPGGDDDLVPCECCDCCTDDEVDVIYKIIDGNPPPACDDTEVLAKYEELLAEDPDADPLIVELPYSWSEDSNGSRGYSYNTDYIFHFFAQIAVKYGAADPPPPPDPGKGESGSVGYSFFGDIFNNKALFGSDETDAITPKDLKPGWNDQDDGSPSDAQSKIKVVTKITSGTQHPFFFQSPTHCKYSFDDEAIVTTMIVENEEESHVYKILNSDVAITCEDDDYEEVTLVEFIDPLPVLGTDQAVPAGLTGPAIEYGPTKLTFSSLFGRDLLYSGITNTTDEDLKRYQAKIDEARENGLEKLRYDRDRNRKELPVQLMSSKLLDLTLNRSGGYDDYFEDSSSYTLYNSNGVKPKTFINTEDGFLSIKAFGDNLIAFDPNPGDVYFTDVDTPYFPTFDPIYLKRTYDTLLEYIYTAIYPNENVPVFPNFRIGEFVVNGALYNPLYDFRNYRTFGYYQSFTSEFKNEKIFISDPISLYKSDIRIGKLIQIGDNYYQIKTDYNNQGAILTSISSDDLRQKVKPSGIIFREISKTLFDLNPTLQVTL